MNELQAQTDQLLKALSEIDQGQGAIFFAMCGIMLVMIVCTIVLASAIVRSKRRQ